MTRPHLLLLALLAPLAWVIVVHPAGRVAHPARRVTTTASGRAGDALDSGVVGAPAFVASTARPAVSGSLDRTREESRRRLREGAAGTYIRDILADHDSALARWPDRRGRPLLVWVQPDPEVWDFDPGFSGQVRDAFVEWEGVGIPLRFSFTSDSATADVHVTWIERFRQPISGKTIWSRDDDWWIVGADIVLAVHHATGEPLDASAVHAIALHEIGHLIGLDHTRDTTTIMTPRVRVRALTSADRATAQLLYALPPGRVRAE